MPLTWVLLFIDVVLIYHGPVLPLLSLFLILTHFLARFADEKGFTKRSRPFSARPSGTESSSDLESFFQQTSMAIQSGQVSGLRRILQVKFKSWTFLDITSMLTAQKRPLEIIVHNYRLYVGWIWWRIEFLEIRAKIIKIVDLG